MKPADYIIASHDAGGAEILSSWALANPGPRYRFCLAGPALAVFSRKIGPIEKIGLQELDAAMREDPPGMLILGTSWQSDLEREACTISRRLGIRAAAYLDHWANFRERFGYPGNWLERLPEEIWCPDRESMEVCLRDGFPPVRLILKGNPYLDGVVGDMLDPTAEVRVCSVLYVTDPIGEHMEKIHGDRMFLGFDEFSALRHFFDSARQWAEPPSRILVRPHPSEPRDKYDGFLEAYCSSLNVERSDGSPLASEINPVETVVGCESMAMVVALKLGKKVLTSIPPSVRACELPFAAIRNVADPALMARDVVPGSPTSNKMLDF